MIINKYYYVHIIITVHNYMYNINTFALYFFFNFQNKIIRIFS